MFAFRAASFGVAGFLPGILPAGIFPHLLNGHENRFEERLKSC